MKYQNEESHESLGVAREAKGSEFSLSCKLINTMEVSMQEDGGHYTHQSLHNGCQPLVLCPCSILFEMLSIKKQKQYIPFLVFGKTHPLPVSTFQTADLPDSVQTQSGCSDHG